MKEYNPPKPVTVVMRHMLNIPDTPQPQVEVELVKYDANGIVFYDRHEFGGRKVFIPYSNIASIVEGH